MSELHQEKFTFGRFYYRFPNGESPADGYMRASIFLEQLYRRWERSLEENLVIVSHSQFISIFLMRFFRFTLEQYYAMDELTNCELIVLERPINGGEYSISFVWPTWEGSSKDYNGLRFKDIANVDVHRAEVWNGGADEDMKKS